MANKIEMEIEMISRSKIRPNPWNPNDVPADIFNELVSNIEDFGFVQPIIIGPVGGEDYEYEIIDGEHRFDGLEILDVDEIPCIVKDVDEDIRKFQTVKMNRLRGKFDRKRFTSLVQDLMKRHSFEDVAAHMAFTDPTELESMIANAKDSLPSKEMKDALDEAKDDIKTVDDLSAVLNRLFTQFGDTVPANFMILDFNGKQHIWVRMGKSHKKVQALARKVMAEGYTFDSFLVHLLTLTPVKKFVAKFGDNLEPLPEKSEEDIDDI